MLTLFFVIFDVTFSWRDVLLNFAFLGYFGKLPGNGHLWFVTVLMACYAEYVILNLLDVKYKWFPEIYLICFVLLMILSEILGLAGNAFAILGLFAYVYLRSEQFEKVAKSMNVYGVIGVIVANAIVLWLCVEGLFERSRILYFLLIDVCGTLLLALGIWGLPNRENRMIQLISSISFEIYIVHHTLCAGPFIWVSSLTNSHVLNYCALVVASFFSHCYCM